MNAESLEKITVNLAERSYPIYIGSGILTDKKFLSQAIPNAQIAIVSNETIAPLYLETVTKHFVDCKTAKIILPDGEDFKTLKTLESIFDALMQNQFDRSMALCSLGGGVVGDMTGFAASCYRRGVDFYQIPTTLLAQVDAAVGGKTAVNHPLGKNMIGAFYQPKAVLIDVDTLKTLPEREYKAGLAEVIKYGFIKDAKFFQWLQENHESILKRDTHALIYLIKHCCQMKADIVSVDERETGERALLNFGHSFGHALEAATNYKAYLHGEAVAIGMVAASLMSLKLGFIKEKDYQTIVDVIQSFGLPTHANEKIKSEILKQYLLQDKKILAGELRLILLAAIGSARIVKEFPEFVLDEVLSRI